MLTLEIAAPFIQKMHFAILCRIQQKYWSLRRLTAHSASKIEMMRKCFSRIEVQINYFQTVKIIVLREELLSGLFSVNPTCQAKQIVNSEST